MNVKNVRFNVTAEFSLTSSELDKVETTEDLRSLMSARLLEKTHGAVEMLCANSDGTVAATCDDPALDATVETLRAVESAVAVASQVKPRTLVARSLSALYADRLELQPVANGVSARARSQSRIAFLLNAIFCCRRWPV